ncbi:putative spermidine/putrescine transport system permease protein [Sporobacter termitidis DSM 10068]|uniref:Putative spermidine/putrescine transport system permease protein n=1 Tax=Sporobacter termitidis DSM 10068 TaxID=1123282 RepID=A0A1M5XB63_9FIRM|nr:ABC transporter permease [Sporobacter termitidis]SHH97107.1 putative spermidine/putrescine transport system permease protein [Sporobacter termitidis DSM 10068]
MDKKRRARPEYSRLFGKAAGILVYIFMALPIIVIIFSAFSPSNFPEFPPTGFSLKWFVVIFTKKAWLKAIRNSLILLVLVTPITTILGTLASYSLHRLRFKGSELLQSFMLSPLMIPQIVLGIALLYLFSNVGWTGTYGALIISQVLIAFPYVVRSVNACMASLDPVLESASMSLGANNITTFRRITLPLIRPGIIAGAVFAAVTSFGEVSISLFLSSPTTMPVSVRVFNYIEQTFDPAVTAVSVIFVILSIVVLFIVDRTIGLSKAM